jgi:hypothetical protein
MAGGISHPEGYEVCDPPLPSLTGAPNGFTQGPVQNLSRLPGSRRTGTPAAPPSRRGSPSTSSLTDASRGSPGFTRIARTRGKSLAILVSTAAPPPLETPSTPTPPSGCSKGPRPHSLWLGSFHVGMRLTNSGEVPAGWYRGQHCPATPVGTADPRAVLEGRTPWRFDVPSDEHGCGGAMRPLDPAGMSRVGRLVAQYPFAPQERPTNNPHAGSRRLGPSGRAGAGRAALSGKALWHQPRHPLETRDSGGRCHVCEKRTNEGSGPALADSHPVVSTGHRNTSLIRGGCDGAWLSEVVGGARG